MVDLRVCHIRGVWKDGPVCAGRVLNEKSLSSKPLQHGFVCLVSTVSLSGIILFGSRYSSLLALDLRRFCPLSELAMLTTQRSTGGIPKKSATRRKACPGPCSSLVPSFLLPSVSFPLNDSLTLRYSSQSPCCWGCCCHVPGLLCSPARRYRPVCLERVPQRGGSSPASCSSAVR